MKFAAVNLVAFLLLVAFFIRHLLVQLRYSGAYGINNDFKRNTVLYIITIVWWLIVGALPSLSRFL